MQKKVTLNVIYIPLIKGKAYIVTTRDDLSRQVEAYTITKANSKAITKFIKEEIFYRYS